MDFAAPENDPFAFVKPDADQKVRHDAVRHAMNAARRVIFNTLPRGHYRKRALDSLQEAAMWANLGVSRTPEPVAKSPATQEKSAVAVVVFEDGRATRDELAAAEAASF